MSDDPTEINVPSRHVNASFPSDWSVVRANGEVVVIHEPGDEPTRAYTIGEPTKNPRTMASAAGVMWEGQIAGTWYEDGILTISHAYAGRLNTLPIDVLLDEAVPTLERTESVSLDGVGGRVEFTCIDCGEHVDRERHHMDTAGITPSRCTSCTFASMGGRR